MHLLLHLLLVLDEAVDHDLEVLDLLLELQLLLLRDRIGGGRGEGIDALELSEAQFDGFEVGFDDGLAEFVHDHVDFFVDGLLELLDEGLFAERGLLKVKELLLELVDLVLDSAELGVVESVHGLVEVRLDV